MFPRFFAPTALFAATLAMGASLWLSPVIAQHDPEIPYGVWVWSAQTPPSQFELTISTTDDGWMATANGETALVTQTGTQIRVEGGVLGWLEATPAAGNSDLVGVWRQAPNDLAYLDMATPVRLSRGDDGRWQTMVHAQPRPFRFYLHVFQTADGQDRAVIRNPERNEVQGAISFEIRRGEASDLVLFAGNNERSISHAVDLNPDGSLDVEIPWMNDTLTLHRADETTQRGYFARPPEAPLARYQAPARRDDGWTVSTAADQGFDESILDQLVAELASTDPASRRPRRLHSLLVARGGELVFEEYFYGYDPDNVHDTRSLGKVFGTIMVGALQQQGVNISPSDRVVADFYEREGWELEDPRKADITLRDMMLYQTGLDCAADDVSAGSESRMWSQTEQPDYWAFVAQLPVLYAPGERYAYCSGSADFVGSAIAAASGQPVLDVWETHVAQPLDFAPYHWNLSPAGSAYLGGGPYMRPRDLLKLGQVYVSGGMWNGQRILPEAWVEESTTPGIRITPETTRLSPEAFSNDYSESEQAYIWRIHEIEVGERSYRSYENTGNGGQLIIVVPELDMVVVMTGGNYRMGWIWNRWRDEIVGGYLIPALQD